jgi:AraC family transcriptional regulator
MIEMNIYEPLRMYGKPAIEKNKVMSLIRAEQTYKERIEKVTDYIAQHLSEPLTLDDLAQVACFSPFHFHRIFTSLTGETPRDFIERLKMERAANLLCVMPHKTVAEISYDCGYTSLATFSRSFKKYYRMPPSEFVKKHRHDFHSINAPHSIALLLQGKFDISTIEIISLPEFHVAYTQTRNGYASGIPRSWDKLMQVALPCGWLHSDTVFLGIPFDNPGITPYTKCRYRACISADADLHLTRGEIKTMDIGAGRYARYHFKGTISEISNAYALLYGAWLPQSGYIPDEKPLLEIYPPELHRPPFPDVLEYDIVLPVKYL